MEIFEGFKGLTEVVTLGAMALPVVVSLALGALCVIWNVFN